MLIPSMGGPTGRKVLRRVAGPALFGGVVVAGLGTVAGADAALLVVVKQRVPELYAALAWLAGNEPAATAPGAAMAVSLAVAGAVLAVGAANLTPVSGSLDRLVPDPPPFLDTALWPEREPENPFSVMARPGVFVGHDPSALRKFAAGDGAGMRWTLLTGPVGAGKSRTALAWLRTLDDLDRGRRWDAGYLQPGDAVDRDTLARWPFRRATAIVIEDAWDRGDGLWHELAALARNRSPVPVRVLLVDQQPVTAIPDLGDAREGDRDAILRRRADGGGIGTDAPPSPHVVGELDHAELRDLAAQLGVADPEGAARRVHEQTDGRALWAIAALIGSGDDAAGEFRSRGNRLVDAAKRARRDAADAAPLEALVVAALAGPIGRDRVTGNPRGEAAWQPPRVAAMRALTPDVPGARLAREIPALKPDPVAQAAVVACAAEAPEAARRGMTVAFAAAPAVARRRYTRLWLESPDAEAAFDLAAGAAAKERPDAAWDRAGALLDLAARRPKPEGAPDPDARYDEQHAAGEAGELPRMLERHVLAVLAVIETRPDGERAEGIARALHCALKHLAEHAAPDGPVDAGRYEARLSARLLTVIDHTADPAARARRAASDAVASIGRYAIAARAARDAGRARALHAALLTAWRRLDTLAAKYPADGTVHSALAQGLRNVILAARDRATAAARRADAAAWRKRAARADRRLAGVAATAATEAAAVESARASAGATEVYGDALKRAGGVTGADRLYACLERVRARLDALRRAWPTTPGVAEASAASEKWIARAALTAVTAAPRPDRAALWRARADTAAARLDTLCDAWCQSPAIAEDRAAHAVESIVRHGNTAVALLPGPRAAPFLARAVEADGLLDDLVAAWPDRAEIAQKRAEGAVNAISCFGHSAARAASPPDADAWWARATHAEAWLDVLAAMWPDHTGIARQRAQGAPNTLLTHQPVFLATTGPPRAAAMARMDAALARLDALGTAWPGDAEVAAQRAKGSGVAIQTFGRAALRAAADAASFWTRVAAAGRRVEHLLSTWAHDPAVAPSIGFALFDLLKAHHDGANAASDAACARARREAARDAERRLLQLYARWRDARDGPPRDLAATAVKGAFNAVQEKSPDTRHWFALARDVRARFRHDPEISRVLAEMHL